jgi:chromosome segregation ATPase
MKQYLPTALTLVCLVLLISLVVMKRGDNTRHENDVGTIADFSNRLDSAQMQVAFCNGTMITLSNSLDECQSASATFSNRLTDAEATIILDSEQITYLNKHTTAVESENQTLGRRVMELTNQVAGFTKQIALTGTNLNQAYKDYALLENRLRRDVAERVVVERKFNNPLELQAQMEKLKNHPAEAISTESIYAGLEVEVTSNGLHVISPN